MLVVIKNRKSLAHVVRVAMVLFSTQQIVLGFTPQTPAPDVVTIVVIDCSASMAAERLNAAKNELANLRSQSPCTVTSPWILVPFSEQSTPTGLIQDDTELLASVQGLRAEGGTRIAAGLNAAATICEQHDNSVLRLILITDAEDTDLSSVTVAEERLAEIFGERSETSGLPAQLIVRRWGNGGITLAKRLAEEANVQVIDSLGSSRLVYVILDPQIKTDNVTRSEDHLTVTITANVLSQGDNTLLQSAPLVQCLLNEEKLGLDALEFEIDHSASGVTQKIKIPFPSDATSSEVL